MKIEDIYQLYTQHFLVDTDTRTIRKNTIFFALKGDNFNGNAFAEEALKQGASYAIIDEEKYNNHPHTILVDDVLETLQALAQYHRQELAIPIIGLTGSNGKTTTKELINAVLSTKYKTSATKGNLNNHIGVPLTILSMTPETEIGIVEMGANHKKEIAFLCTICKPDFGYITNFGKAHLEGFGGIEGVIIAKSELYAYLKEHNKTVFINPQDPIQVDKTKSIESIPFLDDLQFMEVNPFVKLALNSNEIQSNLIGKYNYTNIAVACTIGNHFKVSNQDIKAGIENYTPENNRSQIIKKRTNTIILDAYNANPTSMKAALENFEDIKAESKTVILGDMFELGKTSLEEHQNIVNFVESLHFNNCFFVGANFHQTKTKNSLFKTFEDLLSHLKNNPLKHQSILIKGSRGMRLERLLDAIS
ncbi:UDP-N-acetylmuramoyl-tripeptide--D-alanyl-D-alanine ligase [Polaribacter sp. R2A056_3_33]|uniref:UDP-N-acetylmuramoyl-tripeptide--D-alanyl-D- alanine ligase n=1 Tax=Polaribacter sp. R2A056_3_33 TaxID=2745563 RepID=UPI001C500A78|nr:UDP-N-acetylmuramoyl-tripeptide--D-alanyl-D-alanine ligase [Polaribacter sp. R2A056_3_33]QXP69093.1 UDP-N-acetylmuramoyl-tripeptide--D-alanyl-D-alanine ligase [Polaribacter sp. R2A056_3_33]